MRCEVVAIGTELLLGIIVDGNSAWIGEQLALAGIDSYFQVKVGDNFGRIEACIRQALERSDAVICCGGLGPTQDDITRDVIARVMGVEMRRDAAIADKIRKIFESRGRVMSANNLRQPIFPWSQSHCTDAGHGPGPRVPRRRQGYLRGARRAQRDAGDGGRHHPARPAPAHGPDRGHPQPRAAHLGRQRVRRCRDGGWPRR
jgi:nicotinamide-nucleotide amidase